ncbi:MAG: membrane protein insertase YidC [Planctomycetota bacterium]|jgi:YidC/Oxa1 family membrane protein insertase
MSPETRRIVIPLAVTAVAMAILAAVMFGRPGKPPTSTTPPAAAPATGTSPTTPAGAENAQPPTLDDPPAADDAAAPPPPPTGPIEGLHALAPAGGIGPGGQASSLGSFDPFTDRWKIDFASHAAGIESIILTDQWETASGRHEANRIKRQIRDGTKTVDDLPAEERYVLGKSREMSGVDVPILAAHSIVINDGDPVLLFGEVWSETAPGSFLTEILDGEARPVLRIIRRFVPGDGDFDLVVEQRLENLTGQTLTVRWIQYGPGDLRVDRSRYLDRRRFRFGYLLTPSQDPSRSVVLSEDNDLLFERIDVVKRWERADDALKAGDLAANERYVTLWPNETSRERDYELSWFASTTRYFGLAVHPLQPDASPGGHAFTDVVETIQIRATDTDAKTADIFTYLFSPVRTLAAGETAALDMGLYAGPLDRHILGGEEPYRSLSMQGLILYQMSSFCAICTFQWLAKLLLVYLSFLESWTFDWGVAIILLVITVRALLHPITKKSQISMQRFGKQMQNMKPELDRLKKKYGEDAKRMQQEQMRLFREHGVSPLGCLGFLPMFLQMPIWVALYAMLYFAFDIRHVPAFYGFFQLFGGWPFLADLSASDHFFGEFNQPFTFFLWNVTGINVLPILMGAIFYVQQKYMSPPPSPSMSAEQLQQQKMMRVITVVLFPLMLYSAPSGLTLYILTSSCIGVVESRYIRQHVTEMDLEPKKGDAAGKKKKKRRKKPRDAQGRAFAAAMDRAKAKAADKRRGPKKSYKKRG